MSPRLGRRRRLLVPYQRHQARPTVTSTARFVLPLCLGLLVGACASSRQTAIDPPPTHSEINRILSGETARIQFTDGSRVKKATHVILAADSVYFERDSPLYTLSGEELIVRPLKEVAEISYVPRPLSGKLGMIGLVPGALLVGVAFFDTSECGSPTCGIARGLLAFLGAGVAVVGILLGSFAGRSMENHVVVYERNPTER